MNDVNCGLPLYVVGAVSNGRLVSCVIDMEASITGTSYVAASRDTASSSSFV